MDSFESKKLALIRIWQILNEYSNFEHPLTQDEIKKLLDIDYGIILERKTISRNISLLKEAGVDIKECHDGCFLATRDFEDSELHLLIDSVLCSRHISASYSKDLINRLCKLSSKHFKSHVKNVYSVNDWNKTDNQAFFYNVEVIDEAIEHNLQISYDFNKYGVDMKMYKSSRQTVSPYLLLLHNQRYYLMAYSEYWKNMVFHRLDRITNIECSDEAATQLRSLDGYKNGIDYKSLASAMPYMYTDKPEAITFIADKCILDQIVDWFGKSIGVLEQDGDDSKLIITVNASPTAMEHWAMQYINHVEITEPLSLRNKIKEALDNGVAKYE
ncbi:MAG: WYL domain-containing protein [Clostridiales bacterium]|nr:WYL domain-containing protein [Clostridiales bacterium]